MATVKFKIFRILTVVVIFGIFLSVFLYTSRTPPELVEIPLPQVMRIAGEDKAQHLEVPILRYKKSRKDALTVDFLGAVHIGETHYYQKLNELFKGYDSVLFELIADIPKDARLEQNPKRQDSSLGSVQRAMADVCGLSFQLDHIDYSAANLVHADLSPQQLHDAMSARGETPLKLIFKLVKLSFDPEFNKKLEESGITSSGLDGINPLLIILRGPSDAERAKIKRFMAQGLVASEAVLAALEGERGVSLIDDRNAAIVQVLRSEIASGKKRIGIFYGAGHAPDLHERLRTELGLKLTQAEWLQAWDVGK
jgi:hypothetical protein